MKQGSAYYVDPRSISHTCTQYVIYLCALEQPMPLQNAQPEWLDLKTLCVYACASEKTLRNWIHSPDDPLPASQRGNKIYVRRRDFDLWMQRHALKRGFEINRVVDDIISTVKGNSKA
jgi:Helix-turn-helix domain